MKHVKMNLALLILFMAIFINASFVMAVDLDTEVTSSEGIIAYKHPIEPFPFQYQGSLDGLKGTPPYHYEDFYQERERFDPISNGLFTQVKGDIKTAYAVNWYSGYNIIHERELYLLDNSGQYRGDVIEIVAQYFDESYNYEVQLKPIVYDENVQHADLGFITFPRQGIPKIEYNVTLKNGKYLINFTNTATQQKYNFSYIDTDNPSTTIGQVVGSSELYIDIHSPKGDLNTVTSPIHDNWYLYSGSYYRPRDVVFHSTSEYNSNKISVGWRWLSDKSLLTDSGAIFAWDWYSKLKIQK